MREPRQVAEINRANSIARVKTPNKSFLTKEVTQTTEIEISLDDAPLTANMLMQLQKDFNIPEDAAIANVFNNELGEIEGYREAKAKGNHDIRGPIVRFEWKYSITRGKDIEYGIDTEIDTVPDTST